MRRRSSRLTIASTRAPVLARLELWRRRTHADGRAVLNEGDGERSVAVAIEGSEFAGDGRITGAWWLRRTEASPPRGGLAACLDAGDRQALSVGGGLAGIIGTERS